MKKRVSFNSPVSLIFAICCLVATLLSMYLPKGAAEKVANFFNAPNCQSSENPFNWKNVLDYLRLFFYVFKHSDWNHLLSNLAFILLIGPMMETRYGKTFFALMMATATFVAGILCAALLPNPMFGASGVVFLLILLNMLASITKSEIPLTFILVLVAFLAKEILTAVATKNIAIIAQIAGAVCGSLFKFLVAPKGKAAKSEKIETLKPIKGEEDSPRWKNSYGSDEEESPRSKWSIPAYLRRNRTNAPKEEDSEVIGTLKL